MNDAPTQHHRLATSALCNWGGFVTQIVVAFYLTPLFVDGLGRERFGIWSLVESVLAYLTLFDLGVAAAVVRHTAALHETRDLANLNRVFSTSVLIFASAGAAVVVVCGGLAWCVGLGPLDVPADLAGDTRAMLLLLGVNLGVQLPAGVYPAVLDGLGRFPTKALVRTVSLLVRAALMLWVLERGDGLPGIAVAITACTLAEHVVFALVVHRGVPGLRFGFGLIDRATLRTIRGYSLYALVVLIAARISFQTDALVIQARLSLEWIAPFALAALLVQRGKDALYSLTTVLTPRVSALAIREDHAAIRSLLIQATRYVLLIVLPIQAGFFILGRSFLELWMWRDPQIAAEAYPVLVILAIPFGLAMSQAVTGRVLYGLGQLRWYAAATTIEAAANLVLSLLLVGPLGIVGVAWGTAAPNLVLNAALAVHICRGQDLKLSEYFRRAVAGPLALAAIPTAAWLAAMRWSTPDSWLSLIVVGSAGLALYVPVVLWRELPGGRRPVWEGAAGRVASRVKT